MRAKQAIEELTVTASQAAEPGLPFNKPSELALIQEVRGLLHISLVILKVRNPFQFYCTVHGDSVLTPASGLECHTTSHILDKKVFCPKL